MQFLPRTVTHILIISLIFPYNPVFAGNISDVPNLIPDGSTNTITDRAPNNTPIVNIAAPSTGGVSLNNWSDYNVSSENQILNNAKGATVTTNLAGQIYGNPNFNQFGVNEATTIVNQVTGNNRTNINGATEVAGQKANVVIANGNGIDISGASYINTSNLSLITGSVNLQTSGAIDNFTLGNKANSNIIITGVNTPTYANLGLDASTVDYVDIISRSVQVLGDIHAKAELNFQLGNGIYDYQNKIISSDSNLGKTTKPTFALDSSYLGGMYVDKISLIATEAGIGVRTRGDLVSNAADIVFNVAVDIDYERLQSNTNINLISSDGKITQGKYASVSRLAITFAKGDIVFNGKNGIELDDSSQSNNFYAAGLISLNSASNLIKNNSTIKAESGIIMNSAFFENTSLIFSSDNLSIITTDLTKNTSGTIEAVKDITINSGNFVNSSLIKSGADATITSDTDFIDSNQIKSIGNLSIRANNGIEYNDLYSGGNLNITNNSSGNINHNYKSYSLGATNIINNGGNIIFELDNNSSSGSLYSKGNF